jgi:hypothetical protein
MGAVDRGPDHARVLERMGVTLAATDAGGTTSSSGLPTRSRTHAKYRTFTPRSSIT